MQGQKCLKADLALICLVKSQAWQHGLRKLTNQKQGSVQLNQKRQASYKWLLPQKACSTSQASRILWSSPSLIRTYSSVKAVLDKNSWVITQQPSSKSSSKFYLLALITGQNLRKEMFPRWNVAAAREKLHHLDRLTPGLNGYSKWPLIRALIRCHKTSKETAKITRKEISNNLQANHLNHSHCRGAARLLTLSLGRAKHHKGVDRKRDQVKTLWLLSRGKSLKKVAIKEVLTKTRNFTHTQLLSNLKLRSPSIGLHRLRFSQGQALTIRLIVLFIMERLMAV